jgi:ankyrin repeat protein
VQKCEVIVEIQKQVARGVRIPAANANDERMTRWLLNGVWHLKVGVVSVLWRAGVGSGTPDSHPLHRDRALSVLFQRSGNETLRQQMAQALIGLGCPVNVPDHKGIYPIHYVAEKGSAQMVNFMLRQGASPTVRDSQGRGPLFYARNAATVDVLLAWGANAEITDRGGNTALEYAKKAGYPPECLQALAKDHRWADATELTFAGEINEAGSTFRLMGFPYGSRERDASGETPLMWATVKNDVDTVDYLICQGVDINAVRTDGSTALMLAAAAGHVRLIRMLMGKGADIKAENKSGFTAMMYASREGHTEAVATLTAGAYLHEKNGGGQTARDSATAKGHVMERAVAQGDAKVKALPVRGAEGGRG